MTSLSQPQCKPSPSVPKSTGSQALPPVSVGRDRVSVLSDAMTAAFWNWHMSGCFTAAADYHRARREWENALMGRQHG
jgi:hypothetical protein